MKLNKAKRVMYRLAVWDALGAPTEFMTLPAIKAEYVEEGIQDLPGLPSSPTTLR